MFERSKSLSILRFNLVNAKFWNICGFTALTSSQTDVVKFCGDVIPMFYCYLVSPICFHLMLSLLANPYFNQTFVHWIPGVVYFGLPPPLRAASSNVSFDRSPNHLVRYQTHRKVGGQCSQQSSKSSNCPRTQIPFVRSVGRSVAISSKKAQQQTNYLSNQSFFFLLIKLCIYFL